MLDGATLVAEKLGAAAFGLIVVFYCYEVLMRYGFNAPTRWAPDFVAYALCIGTFLMLPSLTRRHGHVAITLLLEAMPPRSRRHLERTIAMISGAICLAIAWYALGEVIRQYERNIGTIAIIRLPKWWISAFIPLGLTGAGLQFLRLAWAGSTTAATGKEPST